MTQKKSQIKVNTHWVHFFRNMIDSGDLAKFDGTTIKVYLAIKCHVSLKSNRAFPGVEKIATYCGTSCRSVHRALNKLVDKEYLEIKKCKDKRKNMYSFREKVTANGEVIIFDYQPLKIKQITDTIKNGEVPNYNRGETINNITIINNVKFTVVNIDIDKSKTKAIFAAFEQLTDLEKGEILKQYAEDSNLVKGEVGRNHFFNNYNSSIYQKSLAKHILQLKQDIVDT